MATQRTLLGSPGFAAACVLGACFIAGMSIRSTATAPAKFAPAPTRFGTVDMLRLINGLDERTAGNEVLAQRGKEFEGKLKDLEKQIADVENEIKNVIPPDDTARRIAKYAEGQDLTVTLEVRRKSYETMILAEQGDLLTQLYNRARDAAAAFAKAEGYDCIILDDTPLPIQPNSSSASVSERVYDKKIVFASPALDITEALLTSMNKAFAATRAGSK